MLFVHAYTERCSDSFDEEDFEFDADVEDDEWDDGDVSDAEDECGKDDDGDVSDGDVSDKTNTAPRQRRCRKRKRSPASRHPKTVAAEILSLQCKCETPCRHKLRSHVDMTQLVLDARQELHQSGRKHSTEVLFNKLLQRRLKPTSAGKKHRSILAHSM